MKSRNLGEEDYKSFGFISLLKLLVPCLNGVAGDHLSFFRSHLLSFSSLFLFLLLLCFFFQLLSMRVTYQSQFCPSIVFLFLLYSTRDFVSHNYTHQLLLSFFTQIINIHTFTPQSFTL